MAWASSSGGRAGSGQTSCPAARSRPIARRAERSAWALLAADAERTNPETARYLNRLSDLLFILARVTNPDGDVLWEPGAHSGAHAQRSPSDG